MNTNATLTGIYLEGFQSLQKPTFIAFEKLTFLYGPNSAGKSAIHDAMARLKALLPPVKEDGAEDFSNGMLRNAEGSIGIQFLVNDSNRGFTDYGFNWVESWTHTRNGNGDQAHHRLLKYLEGKAISLILEPFGLRIMVDDCCFLQLSQITRLYPKGNKLHCDGDNDPRFDIDDLIEEFGGEVIYTSTIKLNRKSPLYDNTEWYPFLCTSDFDSIASKSRHTPDGKPLSIRSRDANYAQKLVVCETDSIEIRGLTYDYTTNTCTTNHAWDLASDIGNSKAPKLLALADSFETFAIDLCLFIGLIRHMASKALDNSHVRGDRQIITSRQLYTGVIGLAGEYRSDWTDPYGMYCKALNEAELGEPGMFGFEHLTGSMRFDFVTDCMSRFLTSLKGYKIVPQKGSFGEYRLAIQNRSGKALDFAEVGSGISYIFPILVSLWAKRLSFIEQPELHLHPAAQCELGDVFIAAANKGSSAIIESHSEHILLRILRRIKETTNQWLLPPDLAFSANDIVIYYFKPDAAGSTTVKEIRVDKYGEFTSRWPDGFFSERERELFPEYYASKEQ